MSLFNPASIAVIGASATPGKVGHEVFKNILTQGYRGQVYAVNPKGGEILGKKVFTSIAAIGAPVDLAVIITPATTVPGVLEECAAKGITSAIVISAGFKETGTAEGKALEQQVKEVAEKHKIDLLGPNCLGMLCPRMGLNASFAQSLPAAGNVALISQSGAMLVAILDAANSLHLGFSTVLSIGNKTMLDEADFLERCGQDPHTRVIGLYLESIENGRRFTEIAAKVAREKRIVLLKGGTSSLGKRAAASHTGALAGSDGAIDAACAVAGIHRAKTLEEFIDLLRVLSCQPPLLSSRIAIITNAGGPGILAADAAQDAGLSLPSLTASQEQTLKKELPTSASVKNPIDVLGDSGTDRYGRALDACFEDPNIDGCVVLLTPQVMTPVNEVAEAIAATAKKNPLMPVVASFMGGASIAEATAILARHGIPSFDTPERAVRALAALKKRTSDRGLRTEEKTLSRTAAANQQRANKQPATITHEAHALLSHKSGLLSEDDTAKLLALFSLPSPRQMLARSPEEALIIARTIGYPVVAKISSPQILHKTDVGGIRGNIATDDELLAAFHDILSSITERAPDAHIRGILVQQFLPAGCELIIGGVRDSSFGPLVMAGLGGIYTELFHDISFRLAPVAEEDVYAMLQSLRTWKMLTGLRGRKQADIPAIAGIITGVSQMLLDCPQIHELDFNPVLIHGEDVTVADAKIVVE